MHVEHSVIIKAPAKIIFAIYEDVTNWNKWDPDTKSSTLNGPFSPSTTGRLTPTKGNAVPMLVTSVVPHQEFTVESKIPMFRMVFEHRLTPVEGGTKATHKVTFSGLLAFIIGRMLVKQLNTGLPITLQGLKQLAEARSAA
jgi:Polyketide cyclase / dehydrase and lipid transport